MVTDFNDFFDGNTSDALTVMSSSTAPIVKRTAAIPTGKSLLSLSSSSSSS
jgi:hypothetical protein